ncbi:MAG: glycosyltransferase [Proteobacteria bacterium]|nr:glycosyltransferase [Pseudomonadota bacterium]
MSKNNDIIILTPTYDDWDSVFILLGQLDEMLREGGLEASIVVVDDGSPVFADSLDFSELKFSAISDVDVITLTRNIGNQRALAVGISHIASERKCGTLVIMDSDLEDQPKYIPQLVSEVRETGNQIVFAERTRRSEGAVFKIFYKLYKHLYKALTGMPISIGNFSAVPGLLVKRIANISEIWSHFPAGIMRARVPFRSIPATRGQRVQGKSKMNFVALIVHGLSGFAVHAEVVGVRVVMATFGVGAIILAALFLVIAKRFLFDFFVIGWTSLVVIILGIAVVQAFMAAIFMAFMILSTRNQRVIIPAVDFAKFILDIKRVYSQ